MRRELTTTANAAERSGYCADSNPIFMPGLVGADSRALRANRHHPASGVTRRSIAIKLPDRVGGLGRGGSEIPAMGGHVVPLLAGHGQQPDLGQLRQVGFAVAKQAPLQLAQLRRQFAQAHADEIEAHREGP
ncbi:hypothetical protein [Rhodanobacter ginsengiterrae]|uniref:hypothetical protein n=1 Tax=Rhodanobacter ginsengiterrae TaxID=2008451 RepID=UPI003CE6E669